MDRERLKPFDGAFTDDGAVSVVFEEGGSFDGWVLSLEARGEDAPGVVQVVVKGGGKNALERSNPEVGDFEPRGELGGFCKAGLFDGG